LNKYITKADDLVTSKESTRAGFIAFALEKNRKSAPYIEQARCLKVLAARASTPEELIGMKDIEKPLLTAAGLSDKSLIYFSEEAKIKAIKELVRNFLEPAGEDFVNEVVYRYLLIKGDSLGGSMRNLVGSLGQQKLVRSFLSILHLLNVQYQWLGKTTGARWAKMPEDETLVEQGVKAIAWQREGSSRVLAFNKNISLANQHVNVDICLFNSSPDKYPGDIAQNIQNTLLLGELKAGIDPAGADEHWKTANSALRRIRDAYVKQQHHIKTVFIGSAIENKMAGEIYEQMTNGALSNAANLTNERQLVEVCLWIAEL